MFLSGFAMVCWVNPSAVLWMGWHAKVCLVDLKLLSLFSVQLLMLLQLLVKLLNT